MPCGPICPASDALCIAGFKIGWRLWPPTRASFPGRGQAIKKNTLEASKGNQNLIQLGEGLPTVFPPSFSRFCCPVLFLPPTVSDTVGFGYSDAKKSGHYVFFLHLLWHVATPLFPAFRAFSKIFAEGLTESTISAEGCHFRVLSPNLMMHHLHIST